MKQTTYSWDRMTDDEITRLDFSLWLKQQTYKRKVNPRQQFGDVRWTRLVTKRERPTDHDIDLISQFTNQPKDYVKRLADGIDPIILDDFT